MNETIRHKVDEWWRKARQDLRASHRLLPLIGEDIAAYHVCFLAQQAAEKALKGALIATQRPVDVTHQLNALVAALPDGWDVRRVQGHLGPLSAYAVDTRYPDARRDPTVADADSAVQQAAAILNAVARDMRRHGLLVAHMPGALRDIPQGDDPRHTPP